ncbi:signal peptidase I [Parelusimicrobium proximum]|uniref:signal peptidase I n=1 Tax=Parelusimicrobium proximum TaxID=3228953 RepID=UPI003D179376
MEQRLLIIGLFMFVWFLIARQLKKKNLTDNKKIFVVLHCVFVAIFASLALWLYAFVRNGGETPPLVLSKLMINGAIIALFVLYAFFKSVKANKKEEDKIFASDYEWADTIFFSAFLAAFVMFFFIQAFKIPSASMRDTLLEGDHLFVNKFTYGFRLPYSQIRFLQFNKIKKGDVIVFRFPAESREQINCGEPQYGRDFVKRVVGMPGDTIEIRRGRVILNGAEEPVHDYERYTADSRTILNIENPRTIKKLGKKACLSIITALY